MNNYIKKLWKNLNEMTPDQLQANDAEIARLEKEQAEKEKIRRFEKSGVPERYLTESLNSYLVNNDMQATAVKTATNFIKNIKCGIFKSLVLIGTSGTGKTHLACSIVREIGGKYRTAPDLVEELRRAKSYTAAETEEEIISYYGQVYLLVVDEIGRGIAAADEKYMIYQILNARYNRRKPTILISNFSKADFLQYIGVAAADRLVESADILELNGDSFRREIRSLNGGK